MDVTPVLSLDVQRETTTIVLFSIFTNITIIIFTRLLHEQNHCPHRRNKEILLKRSLNIYDIATTYCRAIVLPSVGADLCNCRTSCASWQR